MACAANPDDVSVEGLSPSFSPSESPPLADDDEVGAGVRVAFRSTFPAPTWDFMARTKLLTSVGRLWYQLGVLPAWNSDAIALRPVGSMSWARTVGGTAVKISFMRDEAGCRRFPPGAVKFAVYGVALGNIERRVSLYTDVRLYRFQDDKTKFLTQHFASLLH